MLNTLRPDSLHQTEGNLHQTNDHTAHPGLVQITPHPVDTEQKIVELDLNTSLGPLQPDLVAPDVTTPELRCYTIDVTSPEPKPPRGDSV